MFVKFLPFSTVLVIFRAPIFQSSCTCDLAKLGGTNRRNCICFCNMTGPLFDIIRVWRVLQSCRGSSRSQSSGVPLLQNAEPSWCLPAIRHLFIIMAALIGPEIQGREIRVLIPGPPPKKKVFVGERLTAVNDFPNYSEESYGPRGLKVFEKISSSRYRYEGCISQKIEVWHPVFEVLQPPETGERHVPPQPQREFGLPPKDCGERSPEQWELCEGSWNRTLLTVLWVHRQLPLQSIVKVALPSNETY